MAAVEVSHKAAGVRGSSKITDSYVASFQGLPHIIAFNIHSRHLQDHSTSLEHLLKSGSAYCLQPVNVPVSPITYQMYAMSPSCTYLMHTDALILCASH